MTKEYRAKTFKSGNSVALRLPKGLGIVEGREMRVREEPGRYVVEPIEPGQKKIDLSFLKGLNIKVRRLSPEERIFEDRELDWGGRRLRNRD